MTGPEHYREAERLAAVGHSDAASPARDRRDVIALAQVHATLALADAQNDIRDLLDVGSLSVRVTP